MRAILLAAVLTLALTGCKWPWDNDDDPAVCGTATCAAQQ